MKDQYPLIKDAEKRELSCGEILLTAFDVLKTRFGSFMLLLCMFYLPAAAVLGIVAWRIPDLSAIEDPTGYALALARAYQPYLLWNFGLQFFLLFVMLAVTHLTASELFEDKRLPYPDALMASFRSFWPALTSRLCIELSFVSAVLLMSLLAGMAPTLAFLFLLPFLIYLAYISLMRHAGAVTAVQAGLGGWRNTGFLSALFRENFLRCLLRWVVLCAVALLPQLLLNLLAGFGLNLIAGDVLGAVLSGLLSALLSVFDIFLDICAVIFVNNYVLLKRSKADDSQTEEEQ